MGSEAKLSVASRTFLIVPSWYWQEKKKDWNVKAGSTLLLTEKTPVHPRGCPSWQFCSEFQFYLQNLTHTKLPVKQSAGIQGPSCHEGGVWKLSGVLSALMPEGQLKEIVPRSGWSDFPRGHTSANWRWLTNQQAFRINFSKSFPEHLPVQHTTVFTAPAAGKLCTERHLMAEECHSATHSCAPPPTRAREDASPHC